MEDSDITEADDPFRLCNKFLKVKFVYDTDGTITTSCTHNGFKIKPAEDPADEFGKTIYDIVLEKVTEYNYPVCFDFPVGHQKNNFALKCGVKHHLNVSANETTLTCMM